MTPERARKIAKDCAESWYGGASGLSLKEAITRGILEACQETEGDLVATRAERDTYRQDLAAARAERDELQRELEHLSDMVSAVQELEKQSCAIIRAVSDDVQITTPPRDYSALSPLDCYEAGLLDGGAAVRAHINAAIDAALAGEKK